MLLFTAESYLLVGIICEYVLTSHSGPSNIPGKNKEQIHSLPLEIQIDSQGNQIALSLLQ